MHCLRKIEQLLLVGFAFASLSQAVANDELTNTTADLSGRGIKVGDKTFDLKPIAEHALFVTHAYKGFINDGALTKDTNALVSAFADKHRPVIYLAFPGVTQGRDEGGPYMDLFSPTAAIFSDDGQHRVPYLADNVTVIGGALEACEQRTIDSLIHKYFQSQSGPFTINIPLSASYGSVVGNCRQPGNLSNYAVIREKLEKDPKQIPAIEALFPEEKKSLGPFLRYLKAIYSHDPAVRRKLLNALDGEVVAGELSPVLEIGTPRAEARVEVYLDDHLAFVEGSGTHVVRLKFWSTLDTYSKGVLDKLPSLSAQTSSGFLAPSAEPQTRDHGETH